jgi:predicted dehydrogenase
MKDTLMTQTKSLPKLGFLGVGWIGKNRLEALIGNNLAETISICDTHRGSLDETLKVAPDARVIGCLDDLLDDELDGVVIATPSALHAQQAIKALQAGKAVFCQKPLGRNLGETALVVKEAQKADRLLGVDYSYRYTNAVQTLKGMIEENRFGEIFKVEAVFHNAYGPDKEWFYSPQLSGGGCLIDLGSHLVDLFLYLFRAPATEVRYANILTQGKHLYNREERVEDFAEALICSSTGISMSLGCSWRLAAGKDAEIYFKVYGTKGGASFHNVNGSFYDFQLDVYNQNSTQTVVSPPDDWGGKAIQHWAKQLAQSKEFDPSNHELIRGASILEDIYNYNR